jgi:hypothetical protein
VGSSEPTVGVLLVLAVSIGVALISDAAGDSDGTAGEVEAGICVDGSA